MVVWLLVEEFKESLKWLANWSLVVVARSFAGWGAQVLEDT